MPVKKPLYFKVINANGTPCSGGDPDFVYSLPTLVGGEWKPGAWHTEPVAKICNCGFHVTFPGYLRRYYNPEEDQKVYVAEIKNLGASHSHNDKHVARSIRLLRPASFKELLAEGFMIDGDDERVFLNDYPNLTSLTIYNSSGKVYRAGTFEDITVMGNSNVEITDTKSVECSDNSIVRVTGSTVVDAYGNSKVYAEENVRINIKSENVTVVATGEALVNYNPEDEPSLKALENIHLFDNAIIKYMKKYRGKYRNFIRTGNENDQFETLHNNEWDGEAFFSRLTGEVTDED